MYTYKKNVRDLVQFAFPGSLTISIVAFILSKLKELLQHNPRCLTFCLKRITGCCTETRLYGQEGGRETFCEASNNAIQD
jgi:hypothetical protein